MRRLGSIVTRLLCLALAVGAAVVHVLASASPAFAVGPPKESSSQAVHVVAHVDIAGNAAQGEAPGMLRKLAETSRAEPGCLRFDVLQHMMRANHYTIIEVWQDQKSIDAHRSAAHTKEYRDLLQPMSGSPLDERWYKGVE